jgi:hypothetical protein
MRNTIDGGIMDSVRYSREAKLAWCAVMANAALAAVLWRNSHIMNFLYTWGPQGLALGVMFLFGARPAVITAAACVFGSYLGFYRWYISDPRDALGWLFYMFSLPGGLVAGIAAAKWSRVRESSPIAAGLIAAAFVIAGIAVVDAYWHYVA